MLPLGVLYPIMAKISYGSLFYETDEMQYNMLCISQTRDEKCTDIKIY